MKKFLTLAAFVLLSFAAQASDRITATVTVTNATANGQTFSVNGNVRTFTNLVYNPGTQVLTNSDATGCGSKTNLFEQIALNPFPGIIPIDTGSNTFQLTASCGTALTVSASAGYASVSYSTQTCTTATSVISPFSTYPNPATRTNLASQMVADQNSYSTTALDETQPIAGQLLGTNKTQRVYGATRMDALTAVSPTLTNAVNYGNAFSSPGDGSLSEQFGDGAVANAFKSTTVGGSATTNFASSFGHEAISSGWASTSVGADSTASGTNSFAGGAFSLASGNYSAVLGGFGQATYNYSVAIGPSSATTSTNQIMLGSPGISTVVQNNLTVQSNLTVGAGIVVSGGENVLGLRTNAAFIGTNNFPAGADIAFGRYLISTLANGANTIAPGTNVFIEVSGPSGSFSINGITGGRDGKVITILNQTGLQCTIANESGSDPTPANRIRTLGAGTDLVFTNAMVELIYSGSASRWIVKGHNP